MPKALPVRIILIRCILSIVDQHMRALNEGQEGRIVTLAPLHVGRENQAAPAIFDAIDSGPVQRVAAGQMDQHTHIIALRLRRMSLKLWRWLTCAPEHLLRAAQRMKHSARGQTAHIYREIRRRHQWSYKLLN